MSTTYVVSVNIIYYVVELSHILFQKQQQRVSKENEFYQNLLLDALPFDRITGSVISSQENDDGGINVYFCILIINDVLILY